MPLQNRVTPDGDIIVTPHRGLMMGNRGGAFHLPDRTLGLIVLAVLLAGWRCGLAHRNWSWTNVAGWMLCAFWVGMAACSWLLAPQARASLASL